MDGKRTARAPAERRGGRLRIVDPPRQTPGHVQRPPLCWPSVRCGFVPARDRSPGAAPHDRSRPRFRAAVGPPPSAATLEHALFEVKKVIVGQDRAIERLMVCLLARGHCLLEGVPGLAKTLAAETLLDRGRWHVHPPAVHPRPAARRHRRHPHLPGLVRDLRRRARPDLRQLRPGRRDQPGPGQGAVGAARGHGRAPRVDRRQDLRRARARSSCWPRRTRSRARASTRCPRPSATASS